MIKGNVKPAPVKIGGPYKPANPKLMAPSTLSKQRRPTGGYIPKTKGPKLPTRLPKRPLKRKFA